MSENIKVQLSVKRFKKYLYFYLTSLFVCLWAAFFIYDYKTKSELVQTIESNAISVDRNKKLILRSIEQFNALNGPKLIEMDENGKINVIANPNYQSQNVILTEVEITLESTLIDKIEAQINESYFDDVLDDGHDIGINKEITAELYAKIYLVLHQYKDKDFKAEISKMMHDNKISFAEYKTIESYIDQGFALKKFKIENHQFMKDENVKNKDDVKTTYESTNGQFEQQSQIILKDAIRQDMHA